MLVDSRWSDRGAAHDLIWRPEQKVGQRNQIDSTIQEGSASLPRIEEPAGRIEGSGVAEVGRQQTDLAQVAGPHNTANPQQQGMESHPHRLHAKPPRATSLIDHVASLGSGARKGLLTKQGPSGSQAGKTMLPVAIVRTGDVDDVHVIITGQGFHAVMNATGLELTRESVSSLLLSGRNRGQDGAGKQAKILGKRRWRQPRFPRSPTGRQPWFQRYSTGELPTGAMICSELQQFTVGLHTDHGF